MYIEGSIKIHLANASPSGSQACTLKGQSRSIWQMPPPPEAKHVHLRVNQDPLGKCLPSPEAKHVHLRVNQDPLGKCLPLRKPSMYIEGSIKIHLANASPSGSQACTLKGQSKSTWQMPPPPEAKHVH